LKKAKNGIHAFFDPNPSIWRGCQAADGSFGKTDSKDRCWREGLPRKKVDDK
jgi:hypothetical protein